MYLLLFPGIHFFLMLKIFLSLFIVSIQKSIVFYILALYPETFLNLLQGLDEITGKPPACCWSLPTPICVPKMRLVRGSVLRVHLVRG